MAVIPPKDPNESMYQVSLRSTVGRVAELDLIGETEGRSRNEIADHLLDAGLKAYWKEKNKARPADPLVALQGVNPKKASELRKKIE